MTGWYESNDLRQELFLTLSLQAYAKAINPRLDAPNPRWSIHTTTPGLLAHAIKHYGWAFVPNQVLPPLMANVTVGAILYTSYLQILGSLHPPSAEHTRRVFPPPPLSATFLAGFTAGSIQSLVAAPLDALSVRFEKEEVLHPANRNMFSYARQKLSSIGLRGIFAGWSVSLVKDSLGSGVFFATFEYLKAQAYYRFLAWWYSIPASKHSQQEEKKRNSTITPHYAFSPLFLLFAGVGASVAQQIIQHPLNTFQTLHYEKLSDIDTATRASKTRRDVLRAYASAYHRTWKTAKLQAKREFGRKRDINLALWRWAYQGFWWSTIRQVPSTSAGLIIFELVRRKYGDSDGTGLVVHGRGCDIFVA